MNDDMFSSPSLASTRRDFLRAATVTAATTVVAGARGDNAARADTLPRSLAGVIGITTGGLNHQREQGTLTLDVAQVYPRRAWDAADRSEHALAGFVRLASTDVVETVRRHRMNIGKFSFQTHRTSVTDIPDGRVVHLHTIRLNYQQAIAAKHRLQREQVE